MQRWLDRGVDLGLQPTAPCGAAHPRHGQGPYEASVAVSHLDVQHRRQLISIRRRQLRRGPCSVCDYRPRPRDQADLKGTDTTAQRPPGAMLSRTARPLRRACLCRAFSTSKPRHSGYESTIDNLRIGGDSRVIYQGMTPPHSQPSSSLPRAAHADAVQASPAKLYVTDVRHISAPI